MGAADAGSSEAGEREDASSWDPEQIDVIVVGAGIDALTCAAYAAKAGKQVLVLESRPDIGGSIGTVDGLGARINLGPIDHLTIRGTRVLQELALDEYGLEYLEIDPSLVAIPWTDTPAWVLHTDAEKTLDMLRAVYPGEVDGYVRYLRDALPIAKLRLQLQSRAPSLGSAVRAVAGVQGAGLGQLRSWSKSSAIEVLDEYFVSDELKAPALALGPLAAGLDPAQPGTGLGALAYAVRHGVGAARPQGGNGALAEALARCIEDFHGEIRCGVDVGEIRVDEGRVVGVELVDGEVIEAPIVVSAIDPHRTINELLDANVNLGRHTRRRYRTPGQRAGFGSRIDARASAPPTYERLERTPFLNPRAVAGATTVIAPPVGEIRAGYQLGQQGRVPDRPVFVAVTPSAADPSLQPISGGHMFSVDVRPTPYDLAGGWLDSDEPQRWLDLFCDSVAPGFAESIDEWRYTAPLDVEREFGFERGYEPVYDARLGSATLGRARELTRHRLPVHGLFLTGPATYPGRDIWAVAGRTVAGLITKTQG